MEVEGEGGGGRVGERTRKAEKEIEGKGEEETGGK